MTSCFLPRRRALTAALPGAVVAALVALPATTAQAAPSTTIIINEVYGGGGNAGATYTNDFIELKNIGTTDVDVSTWSVQYASSTGTSYQVTGLTGQIPAGATYLVQEAKGAGGTTPLPAPDATGAIAMSGTAGKIALVSNSTGLACEADCDAAASVVDFVGYGAANDYETAPAPAPSNTTSVSRQATGADTDNNAADFTTGSPTPVSCGEACAAPPPPPPPPVVCGEPATFIHQIQGSGDTYDPTYGGTQTIEGVVIAAMLGGVFVQEEYDDVDGNPETSEGIFVYLSGRTPPEEGSVVRVTGAVSEFGGKTQLSNATVEPCGSAAASIEPTPVRFPLESPGELERFEGMRVEFPDELVISEYFNYDRFGEVVVADPPNGWDRLYTPTAVVEPGPDAVALAAEYAKRRITVDDASTAQNPSSIPHPGNGEPFSLQNRFRGGDTITAIQGVMDQAFGAYRLQPTKYGQYTARNPRPAEAPAVGGHVKVASFNVLNYFLTLDQDGNMCGPDRTLDCRGANTAEEFDRQRNKILSALVELDADVVGLMEMENTTGVEPAADLVAGLNNRLGAGTYDYVDTGVVGTDAIRVGFLYQPGVLRLAGHFDVLDSSDDPRFVDTKSRPMLTQTFDEVSSGARFTVSVNHLKSKGSSCDDIGDPDTGDGQGNCNQTRTQAAKAIVDHLATDPTNSGDPDRLIIGDLNSYDHEDPIDALKAGGFTDLVKQFGGEFAYGYVFDGQTGYLDHALSNPSLTEQVTGAAEWHINADEPDVLDYDTSFKPSAIDAIYAPDQYRSSDHDAVLVGLELTFNELVLTAAASPGTITYREEATVSGTLRDASDGTVVAGATVHLESRTTGEDSWTDTGQTATTAGDGSYSFTVSPEENTQYRTAYVGDSSNGSAYSQPVAVEVATKVTLHPKRSVITRPGSVLLTGLVAPNHRGQVVKVQRLASQQWRTVARVFLDSDSFYKYRVRMTGSDPQGTTLWRTVKPNGLDHARGVSRTVSIIVR